MDHPKSLHETRYDAAVASGGTSSEPIYESFLRVIEREEARGDVLDWGAGTGELTRRLLGVGAFSKVSAADLLDRPEGLPEAVQWIQQDLNKPTVGLRDDAFDVLVAAEVIEHLENPYEAAREWFRVLRPGGLLVCSTPNSESIRSWISYLIRGHFAAFTDANYPAHVTALLRVDLRRCLTAAGFEPPRFVYSNQGVIPKLTSLTWQQISFGLLRSRLFSDNLLAVTRSP